MSESIEVVTLDRPELVTELAEAMYANAEPAFQIDGVRDYEDLQFVFGAVANAAHRGIIGLGINRARLFPYREVSGVPHVDVGFQGLGVHQDLTGVVPIMVGTSRNSYYRHTANEWVVDPAKASNIKSGEAIPRRLTVLSAGGVKGLLPTAHIFDRRQESAHGSYATYRHQRFRMPLVAKMAVSQIAEEAFGILDKRSVSK